MAKKARKIAIQRCVDEYNEDDLEVWQKMVEVLGIDGYYPSKKQCRKAIKRVHVNIRDFLEAVARNQPVPRYKSTYDLLRYTESEHRFFPRKKIESGSPLSCLLRDMA